MTIESNTGLNVPNHYGPRNKEDGILSGGNVFTSGSQFEAVVYISGDDFNSTTKFETLLTLPAGAFPVEAIFDVTEAFTLGNANNVFNIGTVGSEGTNGFSIANPDATGVTKDTSGAGTFAAALAANTAIGVSVTGTTPGVTAGSGKAKVVIRYQLI